MNISGLKISDPNQLKNYIFVAMNRIEFSKRKKKEEINQKKKEIINLLKENRLADAKKKMNMILLLEDTISAYDIISPLLEIMKERTQYIFYSNKSLNELRYQLDPIIYASTRLEITELLDLKLFFLNKFGPSYLKKVETNEDNYINIDLINKLTIKPIPDQLLIVKLKELCKEKKFQFEFPSEPVSDITQRVANPFETPIEIKNPFSNDTSDYNQGNNNSGNNNPNNKSPDDNNIKDNNDNNPGNNYQDDNNIQDNIEDNNNNNIPYNDNNSFRNNRENYSEKKEEELVENESENDGPSCGGCGCF